MLAIDAPTTTAAPVRHRSKPTWIIRLQSWEYWPFGVVYVPVFLYWLWLSVRARSLFFFSASNPGIETGGLLGESKWAILRQIPLAYRPKTLFVADPTQVRWLLEQLDREQLTYPLIAKPDVGERGRGVEKIDNEAQLIRYAAYSPSPFLVQSYVDYPLELGVFYYRMPGSDRGAITSVVQKEFLSVWGNGHDTLEALIRQNDRAMLQWPTLQRTYADQLAEVLPTGEQRVLEPIGNHCRGTTFLDANHVINEQLVTVFDQISQSVEGFYIGRYDLRCRSVEDLYAGRYIQIVELNGAGAEPAHIYQPGFSLWKAWGVLLHHWRLIYEISRINRRRGTAYMTLREGYDILRKNF